MDKAERAGSGSRQDNRAKFTITSFIYSALSCVRKPDGDRDHQTMEFLEQSYRCPFKSLRVHGADIRDDTLGSPTAILKDIHDFSGIMRFIDILQHKWELLYPTFSASEIVEAGLDPSPRKFFTNKFLLKYNRVSHELRQLSAPLRGKLEGCVQVQASSSLTPGLTGADMQSIRDWVAGTRERLGEDVRRALARQLGFVRVQHQTETGDDDDEDDDDDAGADAYTNDAAVRAVDLYTLARFLKVDAQGRRPKLAIVYMGDAHVNWIGYALVSMGLYVTRRHMCNVSDRCLVLNEGVRARLRPWDDHDSGIGRLRFPHTPEPRMYADDVVSREDILQAVRSQQVRRVRDALLKYCEFPGAILAAAETGRPEIVRRVAKVFDVGEDVGDDLVHALDELASDKYSRDDTSQLIWLLLTPHEKDDRFWTQLVHALWSRGKSHIFASIGMDTVVKFATPDVIIDLVQRDLLTLNTLVRYGPPGSIRAAAPHALESELCAESDDILASTGYNRDTETLTGALDPAKVRALLQPSVRLTPSTSMLIQSAQVAPAAVADFLLHALTPWKVEAAGALVRVLESTTIPNLVHVRETLRTATSAPVSDTEEEEPRKRQRVGEEG